MIICHLRKLFQSRLRRYSSKSSRDLHLILSIRLREVATSLRRSDVATLPRASQRGSDSLPLARACIDVATLSLLGSDVVNLEWPTLLLTSFLFVVGTNFEMFFGEEQQEFQREILSVYTAIHPLVNLSPLNSQLLYTKKTK